MRILLSTHHYLVVGGIETYLRQLIPALIDQGHVVGVLVETPTKFTSGKTPVVADRVDFLVSTGHTPETEVIQRVDEWAPDVVYQHGLQNLSLEEHLAEEYPSVLYVHGYAGACISGTRSHRFPSPVPCTRAFGPGCLAVYLPRRCGGRNPFRMIREYREQKKRLVSMRQHQAVLVASQASWELYHDHDVPPKKLKVLPLPADGTPLAGPPAFRPPRRNLLFLGRLVDLKGVDLLIRAFRRLINGSASWSLTIAGDGPQREPMEAEARRHGLPCEFLGWVDRERRNQLLESADLLVVPSTWPEPFGLVGVEAACQGLPAVAFDVGGIRDWLTPGETGELAPGDPPTPAGLAEAIERALASPDHLHQLRVGAWRGAHGFSLECHLERLFAVLHSAAATTPVHYPQT